MRRLARPLLYGGTATAVLGFGKYHAAFVGGYSMRATSRLGWSLVYAAVLCVAAYGLGLPDLRGSRRSALTGAVATTAGAATAVSLVQVLLGSLLLPRFVVFASAIVLVPWYVLCAAVAEDGRDRDEDRDRVLAVVGPAEAGALEAELSRRPERAVSLVGVLDPEVARSGDGRRPIASWVADRRANVVVLDRTAAADDRIVAQVADLHESGAVRVRTLTLFYDEWLAKLPLSELERVALMFDIGEMHRARYGRVKRIVDIGAALAGLAVLALVLPFVAVANVAGNRGPLFFRQHRVGRGGRVFEMYKLRSMWPQGAAPAGAGESWTAETWTAERDPRVTPFGRWLRRTHIDELPQAWNVLRGDLTLVGPRPEQVPYVDELSAKIPFYDLRHLVRPGLTGWAQVKYAYGSSIDDALEKLQYEFWYLRHQRLGLDARIAARTLRSVVGRTGR